jgi:hypothetical protein
VRDATWGDGAIVTTNGEEANLALSAGADNDAPFFGHLVFDDRASGGPLVEGTGATRYERVTARTRRIEGPALVNGEDGFTYRVEITDEDDPEGSDHVAIWLSTSYAASGFLVRGDFRILVTCGVPL